MANQGVGIEVVGRPATFFNDPLLTGTFNPAFDPFDSDGRLLPNGRFTGEGDVSPLWSGRYHNGRTGRETALARPRIGAENEFLVGARILLQAVKEGRPPFGDQPFRWLPGEWSGVPNQRELVDVCCILDPASKFAKDMYSKSTFTDPVGSLVAGRTPDNPMKFTIPGIRFPDAQRSDGTYYRFFSEHSVGGQGAGSASTVYVQHSTPNEGPTAECWGYEPGYPEVFGPEQRPAIKPDIDVVKPTTDAKQTLSQVITDSAALVKSHPTGAGAPLRKWSVEAFAKFSEFAKLTIPVE